MTNDRFDLLVSSFIYRLNLIILIVLLFIPVYVYFVFLPTVLISLCSLLDAVAAL